MAQRNREIRWTDEAWEEFLRTLRFYDERNQSSQYSEKLERLVWKKLAQVQLFPEIGELIVGENKRRVIIERTFFILYGIEEDAIVVYVFRDGRRDTPV